MFQKATLFCALFLGLLYICGSCFLGWVRQQDIHDVREQLHLHKIAKSNTVFSTAEQQRKGVVKEIWVSQEEGQRLHHRIASETSLLTIIPKGKRLDLEEKLYQTTCWMQDKIYTDPQSGSLYEQIRLLKAAEGLYKYSSQEFTAQSVNLSLYRLQGNQLPLQSISIPPFLKGIAKNVSFSVSGKNSQFKAQEFKAELNSYLEKS